MKRRTMFAALLTLSLTVCGQSEQPTWEQTISELMTAEDAESEAWEETMQLLTEQASHPINLNTATREDLEQLPFLTAQQVEQLTEHLERYGPMRSFGELRMLPAFDPARLALLPHFVYLGEKAPDTIKPKDLLSRGRHELTGYGKVPLYQRQGDRNGYLGYPYKHWLRYTYTTQHVKAGLVGAQDSGEPFMAGRNWGGYDYYSFFIQLKRLGRLEQLVAGKYKISTGMGLVLNNSLGLGKLATLSQLGRTPTTVRPHASRSAANHFQGVAATVRLNPRLRATAFVSYRALDATLNQKDSTATTLLTDGYHRTPTEMGKKGNTHSTDAGADLRWQKNGFHLGATAIYTHLSRRLQPDVSAIYRRYYPQGQDFLNVSANYGYNSRRLTVAGETAANRQGALATLNTLSLQLAEGLSLLAIQRFYSYRYTALYAHSLSEGGRVQNESAAYLGLTWQPSPRLRLQAYTDWSYAPWAKYQVSQSSYANDHIITANYTHKDWSFQARYRLHRRERDNADKTALYWRNEQRARLSADYTGLRSLRLKTQADLARVGEETGWAIGQQIDCTLPKTQLMGAFTYFRTPSYESRLYTYERGPLYASTFPMLYGEGIRYMVMVRRELGRRLTAVGKLGVTDYFDRSQISSGLQQVNDSALPEVEVQVRWRF